MPNLQEDVKDEDRDMVKSTVKRADGEAWFAEEKFGHEIYHAKVGDHSIVVAIGNIHDVPIRNPERRREHISKVIADNVQRFLLSKYTVETVCSAFRSMPSEMASQKCTRWIESQKGRNPREVILEARRRFGNIAEEILFGRFETAVGRQVRLSPQEWEVARRLADGMSEKEVASKMKSVATNNYLRGKNSGKDSQARATSPQDADQGLSPESVRKVVRALRHKADGSTNRVAAIYWFLGFESSPSN